MFYLKSFVFVIAAFLVQGCNEKTEFSLDETLPLTLEQKILKQNLSDAARLIASIANTPQVLSELAQLSPGLENEINTITFKELFEYGSKKNKNSEYLSFPSLKKALYGFKTKKSGFDNESLLDYLIINNCYLYVPYSFDDYSGNSQPLAIAGHPIDNNENGIGFIFDPSNPQNEFQEVMVNDEYAEYHPVVLILPNFNEDNNIYLNPIGHSFQKNTGNPIYEVKILEFWCRNSCGGLFEGDPEITIIRGESVNETTGQWALRVLFKYPKWKTKAARDGKSSAWMSINTVFNQNWRESMAQDYMHIYDYDWDASKKIISGTVKYRAILNGALYEITLPKRSERASPMLVQTELLRDHFFASQANPGPTDEIRNGFLVRRWGDVKITTSIREL